MTQFTETEFSFVPYKLYENVNASFVLKIGGPYEAQAAATDARRSQKGLQDTITFERYVM